MKKINLVFSAILTFSLLHAATLLIAADDAAAEDKASRDRTESLLADIDCAAKKDRLFYDYLSYDPRLRGAYKFRCASGKETITAPAWLAGEISSMTARAAAGKEKLTEAQLWQAPLAALYDFSELVRKTRPVKEGGLGLPQRFLAGNCADLAVRLDKALANLRRAKLAGSFGGRGDVVFSNLVKAMSELDALERSLDLGSQVTFYEKSLSVMKNGEEAFNALFAEAPSFAMSGGFSAEYSISPRLLPGGRALALELPVYQLEGLKRGDFVDLLVTYDNTVAGGGKDTITATIIQGAQVLSVAKPKEGAEKGSARLLLNTVQAQYAALSAVQARDLRLSVRAEGDVEVKPMEVASFKKIVK
ncbi:MAG: hypothetical protein A2X34_09040 [Elusimicrobia bacterium GWC2_51_8]|nr:MAG: hypothetical protein A2X33_01325 [Elusimicrobia bacterium GWA2_51_34]OGR58389.1 MAG: hypothetical protein A2X34_09040 [Elusimicrobia bacterium GWC2_51_8]OGR86411.1 MAG: hypothetical protein A2021_07350 [Elusimicrobia bacterium GWF2_52_66]HAF96168.1 hypothetical protein [Elusimicrobiota bacterium]HCE97779.1 hypothetical protein [Elusimicrobiota bacterium]